MNTNRAFDYIYDMKRMLLLFIILNSSFSIAFSQAGMWTWVKGDSINDSKGSLGVQGIPSMLNEPHARYASGSWVDTAGNFWIYSGSKPGWQTAEPQNDLWKYEIATNTWTWMNGNLFGNQPIIFAAKGVFDPNNSPGHLDFGMFTWVTPNNHLWLFGGHQYGWELNDHLWQYDPAINQWAWMGGGIIPSINYGTKGIGDTSTLPGGRHEGNCAWTDHDGNLWLFGGAVWNIDSLEWLCLNDMWKYDISTGIWTWMSGTQMYDAPGHCSKIGEPSISNNPSGRITNLFWKDDGGNFWLSGGMTMRSGLVKKYQDIWKFNPKTLEWTCIKGSITEDNSIPIGQKCGPDSINKSGPRYENRVVGKICNNVITYGGAFDWEVQSFYNDLWSYDLNKNEWNKIDSWLKYGNPGIKGTPSPNTFPSSTAGSVGFIKDNALWMFGGAVVDSSFYTNKLWKYVIDTACLNISCPGPCQLSVSIIVEGNTLSSFGASSYQWYLNGSKINGATSAVYIANQPGSYTLEITDANGCTAMSTPVLISGMDEIGEEAVSIYPNPSSMNNVQLTMTNDLVGSKLEVYDANGRLVSKYEIRSAKSEIELQVPKGVYFIRIHSERASVVKRFVRL